MKKTSGIQRTQSEHGKDRNYDVRQKPALTQRLRKTPLVCVIKHLCGVCRKITLWCVSQRGW